MALPNITILIWAFIGGVIPTFFWLWFWLRNDENPEPWGLLALVFIFGALAAPIAIPLEAWTFDLFKNQPNHHIIAAAGIEEALKYLALVLLVLPSRTINESKDYVVYLVTAGLGFAALENMLFLINPLVEGNAVATLAMGNLRFFGATALHAAAGALMGVAMGVVFYKGLALRVIYTIIGIISAIALHALFNFFIMQGTQQSTLITIAVLWIVTVIIIFMYKKLSMLDRSFNNSITRP
jgi:protease PrsW